MAPLARYRQSRHFLFLQGLASPLFARLGAALSARGFGVSRINVCLGDRLFWPRGSVDYRGSLEAWPQYLADHIRAHGVTDIVLFGNLRPYHRIAIDLAGGHGVTVHVFEEGHLRPNWITVETAGAACPLEMPRTAEDVRAMAQHMSAPLRPQPVHDRFFTRAFWDIAANFATGLGRPLYRGYRRHRPNNAAVEYLFWSLRLALLPLARRRAERDIAALGTEPYFLLPLQLDSDYQIRAHSPFRDMNEVTERVIASFARHAPPETRLVVKIHPLDNGMVDRRRVTAAIASAHGVSDRVAFLDGGHAGLLIKAARGLVVINSTIGTQALFAGRPVKALGEAVYDIPGLAFSGSLEEFWREPQAPDPALADAFRRLLRKTQVNGGFFSSRAIEIAIPHILQRFGVPLPAPQGAEDTVPAPADEQVEGVRQTFYR